ncbi:Protein of unknown function DUF262 [Pedobacter terrae]|uniref:Uncharacterized protein n=1 Tax=Pedobacter terrae TaxID=405671 RepID=A0A1G7Q5F9_9SPHI|nr:DUF262 domain-containing protein [Pedobacter terrae]SDF93708.1 Protein of unknown function DUF262 [Pedobacter terrae]
MSLTQLQGLEVASCSVEELLNATTGNPIALTNIQGQLTIPEYQRPYVWSGKQMLRLIADLDAHPGDGADYYLGSLILHQQDGKLNIIDGQQRLTTLLILQAFSSSPDVGIVYDSPLSVARIRGNMALLRKKIEDDQIRLDHYNLAAINVTLVVTDSEDLAYTFFETQNTGGKRLFGADIIKAHHLRAIKPGPLVNVNALRWESRDIKTVSHVISLITKARCWNVLDPRGFPSHRDKVGVKQKVVEEFTERTLHESVDRSFMTVEVTREMHGEQTRYLSSFGEIRQPIYDGTNFMDFLDKYADTYQQLFLSEDDYRIDPRFYKFRKMLINGENGTAFLRDLFQLAVLVYVSRFGLNDLYSFSLWCFRYVYSVRITRERTVREDGVYSFATGEQLIDRILASYSTRELITYFSGKSHSLNTSNCGVNNVKGRYILMLGKYFSPDFDSRAINTDNFDQRLIQAIQCKITQDF